MTMARVEQHLFTAKGYSYETTALSSGVTNDIRSRLEACVGNYTPQNRDRPEEAQWVYRGTRIPQGWAASTMTDAERAFGRDNRIAHTFFVTDAVVAPHGYNLPWIACHAPFARHHKPKLSGDPERLDPIDLEIEADGQFRLLTAVVSDLGSTVVTRSVHQMLTAFKQPQTLVWPAPEPEACAHYATLLRRDAPMPADQIQLVRLAGLFALLPDAFTACLSYSLNEPAKMKTLLSAPDRRTPPDDPVTALPWLAWYLELVETNDIGRIAEVRQELSLLMPVGTAPSSQALECAFAFWRQQRGSSNAARSWRAASHAIEALVGHDVHGDGLYNLVTAAMPVPPPDDPAPFYTSLAGLSADIGRPLGPASLDAVLAHLSGISSDTAALDFIRGLAPLVQAQIWQESSERGVFPGRLRYVATESELRFVLAAFDPDIGVPHAVAESVVVATETALERIGVSDSRAVRDDRYARVLPALRGLTMLRCTGPQDRLLHPKLIAVLAHAWASDVLRNSPAAHVDAYAVPRRKTVEEELSAILEIGIDGGEYTPIAHAEVTLALATHDPDGALRAVLRYVASAIRYPTAQALVRRLRPWQASLGAHAIQCLNELVDHGLGRRSLTAESPSAQLRVFAAWLRECARSRDRRDAQHVDLFFGCVASVVQGMLYSQDALPLGACYLRLHPSGDRYLTGLLLDRLAELEFRIAEAPAPVYGRPYFATVGDLLGAIGEHGSREAHSALMSSLHRIGNNAGPDRANRFFTDVNSYCRMSGTELPGQFRRYLKPTSSERRRWFS